MAMRDDNACEVGMRISPMQKAMSGRYPLLGNCDCAEVKRIPVISAVSRLSENRARMLKPPRVAMLDLAGCLTSIPLVQFGLAN